MYPHERSLVKRMENKPFALLGINSDPAEHLKETIQKEHMTWRSWSDGSTSGPISTAWNVESWPSIFVLDAKGVIRYKDVRGEQLDKAVDTLLKEMGVEPGKAEPEKPDDAK